MTPNPKLTPRASSARMLIIVLSTIGALTTLLATALLQHRELNEVNHARLVGESLPQFSIPTLANSKQPLDSSTLNQGPILINIFASWCIPCRAEHPFLMELSQKQHIPLYGIAWKDSPERLNAYFKELGNPYQTIGLDLDGRTAIALAITGAPETILVNNNGIIQARVVGPLTPETFRESFANAFNKSH